VSIDPIDVAVTAALVVLVVAVEKIDRADALGSALQRVRVRLGRRVPVGWHQGEGETTVRVGRPDTTIVIRMPLRLNGAGSPVVHVARTDQSTRFSVAGDEATLDEFLEAYDDSVGPIDIQVHSAGRVASANVGGGAQ